MKAGLDQVDLDIIGELSSDGRRPFREIARQLGVSEGTIRHRVKKLHANGQIRIAALGSPTALGVACNAMVLIRVRPQSIASAAERLSALNHVRFVGVTLGSSDIAIQTLHASAEELFRFVSERLPDIVPDIVSSETLHIAQVVKSEFNWADWLRDGLIPASSDA